MTSEKQTGTSAEQHAKESQRNSPLLVVGIGSSAGGLEALNEFFKVMPEDSGMAFVVFAHLDPHHDSMLPNLLQGKTRMKVMQITENMLLDANQVYIIPPDKRLAVLNNTLQLMERKKSELGPRRILKKIRTAMAHRDSIYRLDKLIEFDDTYVGGKRAGKRGRGAEGKKPVLVAVEARTKGAGFVAMKAVGTVSKETVSSFLAFHIQPGQTVRTECSSGSECCSEESPS